MTTLQIIAILAAMLNTLMMIFDRNYSGLAGWFLATVLLISKYS